ncbi:MAG: T9SS type A sorting domain-containing protein [Candidatus Bathyarchaeota archaeon]|nr:T9SS type A sorting domain-containing protein [Candidatus Bathyarchaeota archaeon]
MLFKRLILIITFISLALLANMSYDRGSLSSLEGGEIPTIPTLIRIFDNAIINTYPSYECDVSFTSKYTEGDSLMYKIQWDTDPQFLSTPDSNSKVISFYSAGDIAITTIPAQAETIYYWRVYAKYKGGKWTNPSEARSFTMDMDIEDDFPYWYQVTGAQFEQDTKDNVTVQGDSVILNAGQTEGTLITPPVVFYDLNTEKPRTDWDGVKWTKSSTDDSIGVQIQYKVGVSWIPVPDALIPNNSTGIFNKDTNFCKVDLTSLGNPEVTGYDTIRVKAIFRRIITKSSSDPALLMLALGNTSGSVTGISTTDEPIIFALHKNQPNPFVNSTNIQYQIPKRVKVNLQVYDIVGRSVVTLVNGVQKAGYYSINWRGTNRNDVPLPSGVYFLRMEAGEFMATQKMLLLQ